jgi:predicted dienelactone hydrolase
LRAVNVGCRDVELIDPVQNARIVLRLLYPTEAAAQSERFGQYTLDVAMNAPLAASSLPLSLVVISHGTGGSPLVYRELAAYLVRAGFVVALPEHPGNKRYDDGLARTAANLENRPRHIRLTIDAAFADDALGAQLARDGVAVIGHSMGGYTALAIAGGRPTSFPKECADARAHPVAVVPDPRVRRLVLLAPATVWFQAPGALADVDLPILMRTAEHDAHTPAVHAEIVLRGVRDAAKVDHAVVPNAGHFSFLTPFPPSLTSPGFAPSQDPAGFDRAAFQVVLQQEVLRFLQKTA